jgi:DNA-binding NarL/FixJ family response regulator
MYSLRLRQPRSESVTRLDVSLGGSGDAQLVARDVHAVLAGSGRIVTHATDILQASVPGSGDQARRALTLLAAADAAWAAIPATPQPVLREHHDAALAAARDAVPASAFAVAVAEGAAMSQARAIAYALGEPAQREARSGTGPAATHRPLTRREQDVAALVARGLSNGDIAGELVISARTVETHVQHIMDKLGVGTRAQIAAWSAACR